MACDERLADIEEGIDIIDPVGFETADAEKLGAICALTLKTSDGRLPLVDYASAGRGREKPFMAAWIKAKNR